MTTEPITEDLACPHGYIAMIGCADCAAIREKQEEQDAEEQRKRASDEIRQARRATYLEIYTNIGEELDKVGAEHSVEIVPDRNLPAFIVKGVAVEHLFDVIEAHDGSNYYPRRPAGKPRILLGHFGDRANFPQRKDGSYNYAKMAEGLLRYAAQEVRRSKDRSVHEVTDALAKAFVTSRSERGYTTSLMISHDNVAIGVMEIMGSRNLDRPLKIMLKLDLTEDEASLVLGALIQAGMSRS